MKKSFELPITEPIYSTYHHQGSGGAVLFENPSIRNWYLNQVMILNCNRQFLYGYTTPIVDINDSSFLQNPHLDKIWLPMKFLGESISPVIRTLLNDGFYVYFSNVDDYYVAGKSGYHKSHFMHDGLIYGYDQNDQTYSMYAYDEKWIYRKFKTSQKGFLEGRRSAFHQGCYGEIFAIKVRSDIVELNPREICDRLKEYLDSSLDQYPFYREGMVYGTAVHDYIAMYLNKLSDGSIPYERMDKRIFRMVWEHKKAMLERIAAVEQKLLLGCGISLRYREIVKEADNLRMLYASHHMKRRDALLPVLRDRLIKLKETEVELLHEFIAKAEVEQNK